MDDAKRLLEDGFPFSATFRSKTARSPRSGCTTTRSAGTVTVYDGDDPTCTPKVYSATGTGPNGFVDVGGGEVHLIRNEGAEEARTIVVQLIPAGAARRIDAPAPGNCNF